MMSSKVTSPKEEGTDANGAKRDGAERDEGAVEFDCRDQNWASLRLAVT